MKIIIVGAGKIGRVLARELAEQAHDVTVVERNDDLAADMARELTNISVIEGNATERDILEEAGINEADILVSVTSDSATNLLVSLLAQDLGAKKVIARAHDEEFQRVFREAGIENVFLPEQSVAEHLQAIITQPDVYDLAILHHEVDLYGYTLVPGSRLLGQRYTPDMTPADSLIVALRRGGKFLIPASDTIFEAGDKVVVIAKQEVVPELRRIFKA